jgi:Fe-S-cluster-containing hydrogenase component 2
MFKVDKKVCIGCGSCSGVCPVDAISFDENGKSQIDQKKCIHCGSCESVCPTNAISNQDK